MRKRAKTIVGKIFPASGTIRRRMFFLLGGMGVGVLLITNLIWLPGAIKDIRQSQTVLRQVSVKLVRGRIQEYLEDKEAGIRNVTQRFRPFLAERDREGLRLTAQRLLQSEPAFEEIGILDGNGKEIMRLSRRMVITDQDLSDRSASSLFREGMKEETHWEPVTITATSEPWVALTVRLPGSVGPLHGLVFGVINLRSLWNLTGEFKQSREGRVYIVEEMGRLIAAADPSVVLRQLSFADRPIIRRLIDRRSSDERSFVEGAYRNERKVNVAATGLLVSGPRWGVVIEQPQSVLFVPIRQKIWFFAGLSFLGLLFSFGLAQMLSRRLTGPIVRLQEGARQIGDGNFEHRVPAETDDEIGELASQFNRMAEHLHASHQATLSALTIPVMGQLREMHEVLNEAVAKVKVVTEAEAASIRLIDDEKREFDFSVYQGFSKAYMHERPTMVRDEAGGEIILQNPESFISGDILTDSGGNRNPLAREGFRSVVYLPLMTLQKTFGLMTLASREPGRLSSKKADIFRAIAHQISVALENAHLLAARKQAEEALRESEEEAKRLSQENAIMAEIGRIISSTLHIEEVYERFSEKVRQLIPFDRLAVNIINEKDNTTTIKYITGIELEDRRTGNVGPIGDSLTGRAIRNRSSLLINVEDREKLSRQFPDLAASISDAFRSLITVPLISKDRVIGVLHLRSVKTNVYSEMDLRIAEKIGNQIAGAIANAQLFAERNKAQEAKAAIEEQLRQSQKMESIGRLAGGVAHDFNNLLTVIRGYSQLSLAELRKGDPLWENLEEVRKAADRAADLTRQLLAFSRRQILEFKTVNLNNLIQAMEKMLRRMIGEDMELIIHGGENLGSIKTDPGQMEQVIMNLTVNARDAMPSGGKLILETQNIYLDEEYARNHASMKPGYYVKLSVSDTGWGMTPEIRERIFEPFFTTKEKDKGTGLGLSTVYGIVKQSDGNIWVYSEPGKGTTFNIYLPRIDEPVEMLIKKRESMEIPRGNETVLVVEDEEAVRKLAAHTLKKQGYNVLEATRGEEALRVVERHPEPVHLILTDVVMPGMSGPKLVENLRQIRKEFKILFMSGYTDESVICHGVREGEMNFIQKPFTMETIGRKVREVLDEDSKLLV